MKARHCTVTLTSILLATAAAAHSQIEPAAPAPSSDDIIVEGREIRTLAAQYVDRLLPTSRNSQFGRFEEPVCPDVIGLSDTAEKEVIQRMAEVGRAVLVDVKVPPCTPNLFLLVVPDKKEAFEGMQKSRPQYVRGISDSFIKAGLASPRPYLAWQMIQMFTSDGMSLGGDGMPSALDSSKITGPQDTGEVWRDSNSPQVKTTQSPSRLRSNIKPHVVSAMIIVESRALANLDTRQLADFALMQAMVPMDLRDDGPPSASILSVFSTLPVPDEAPQSLTRTDLAFLKALRSVRSDTFSLVQKNEIRGQMIDELERSAGSAN